MNMLIHQVLVVIGETGSGKTTQMTQFMAEAVAATPPTEPEPPHTHRLETDTLIYLCGVSSWGFAEKKST